MTDAFDPGHLDAIAIEEERRQTRPIALDIDGSFSGHTLNDDFLRVTSFQGDESVSQPYQFNLELRANDLDVQDIDAQESLVELMGPDLLGLWARVRVAMPYSVDRFEGPDPSLPPSWEDATPSRFFHGVINGVTMAAPGIYNLTIASPLIMLTFRNRYHVFRDHDMESLIREVLKPETDRYKLTLQFKLEGITANRVQDWLQAGENDLAFLQRVMAKASIHFYAIHEQNQLTLVFSNQTTTSQEVAIPGASQTPLALRYSYTDLKAVGAQQSDLFMELRYQLKMTPQTARSVLTRTEAQWESNKVAGFISYDEKPTGEATDSNFLHHRYYAYGTNDEESKQQLTRIYQQMDTDESSISGVSTSPLLSPGYTFELTQAANINNQMGNLMRTQFSGKVFVVTRVSHKVTDGEAYSGQIEATEVVDSGNYEGTMITPFSMDDTHQGSVIAQVVESVAPKGWRYREKNNFQVESSTYQFDDNVEHEKGCLVRFATASGDEDVFWVRLSAQMQTAPEVNAMVLISRSNDESELPEISSVLASHGSKTIQPADRRKESWTANTSWGSNYSTSYGDSIGMRFGYFSPVDFNGAKQIVESAYDNPDMLSGNYKDSSYNIGGSYGFSESDNGADGVLSASVSQGSNYNENHGLISYGYSDIGTSQNYSQVGKSVSKSVIGDYSGEVDKAAPSFVNGNVPDQSIIDLADELVDGDTYSENTIRNRTINLSGIGTDAPTWTDPSATVFSNSETLGDTVSLSKTTGDTNTTNQTTGNNTHKNTMLGNTTSNSTTLGNNNNTNIQLGNNTAKSIQIGNTTSSNLQIGNTTGSNTTIGDTTNTQTQIGKSTSTSTHIGDSKNTSTTVGDTKNSTTVTGDKNESSTVTGDSDVNSSNVGINNQVSTNLALNNSFTASLSMDNRMSTTLGNANSTEIFLGLRNSVSMQMGMFNSMSMTLGPSYDMSLKLASATSMGIKMGSSADLSINMAANIGYSVNMGVNLNMETNLGAKINLSNNAGVVVELNNGAAAIRTVEEMEAEMSTVKAKIISGILAML